MRRRIKQLVLVGAAIGLLAWATLLLPADNRANAAEREGETSVTGSYTYVLDPEQALIHVTADLVLTHDIEEFRHSVFDGFVLWLPTNAVNTKASAYDGSGVLRPAEREYVHEFDHLEFIIRFRPLVAAGGSIHVVMTWDEPGFGPRSMQATRIDTAAGVFEVSGPGAPRGITYKVVAPPGFAYPDLPPGWVASTEDGSSVATLAATRDPDNYKVSLAVRDQEHMATSVVATDAGNFTVAGWNGDEPWSALSKNSSSGPSRPSPTLWASRGRQLHRSLSSRPTTSREQIRTDGTALTMSSNSQRHSTPMRCSTSSPMRGTTTHSSPKGG